MADNAPYSGWIKIYRSLLDWEWYSDTNCVRLALHFLLRSNYQPKRWQGVTIERGQMITSRARLCEETGLSEREVRTAWQRLAECGFLSCGATSKFTIVTICNYDRYQDRGEDECPAVRPSAVQPKTRRRPAEDPPTTTTKEYKQIRSKQVGEDTHTVVSGKGVVGENAAAELLSWIAANAPTVAAMAEPINEQHATWMLRKYELGDIRRVIMTMHSRGAYKGNSHAYTVFSAYAGMDFIIKGKQADAKSRDRLLTYEQMANLLPTNGGSHTEKDFERVTTPDGNRWRLKIGSV